jgi:hypothetical protein
MEDERVLQISPMFRRVLGKQNTFYIGPEWIEERVEWENFDQRRMFDGQPDWQSNRVEVPQRISPSGSKRRIASHPMF